MIEIHIISEKEIRHIDEKLHNVQSENFSITYEQLLEFYRSSVNFDVNVQRLRDIWTGEFSPSKLHVSSLMNIRAKTKQYIINAMEERITYTLRILSDKSERVKKTEQSIYNSHDIGDGRSVMVLKFANSSIPILVRTNMSSIVYDGIITFKKSKSYMDFKHLESVLQKCSHPSMDRDILRLVISQYESFQTEKLIDI